MHLEAERKAGGFKGDAPSASPPCSTRSRLAGLLAGLLDDVSVASSQPGGFGVGRDADPSRGHVEDLIRDRTDSWGRAVRGRCRHVAHPVTNTAASATAEHRIRKQHGTRLSVRVATEPTVLTMRSIPCLPLGPSMGDPGADHRASGRVAFVVLHPPPGFTRNVPSISVEVADALSWTDDFHAGRADGPADPRPLRNQAAARFGTRSDAAPGYTPVHDLASAAAQATVANVVVDHVRACAGEAHRHDAARDRDTGTAGHCVREPVPVGSVAIVWPVV